MNPESSISRRSFIKRTSGATVAALVATGLGTRSAYAEVSGPYPSPSEIWGEISDIFSDIFDFSDDPPPPPPSCSHNWQYTIEGEDNFSYWGTKTCTKCGATGTFRAPKPNVA
jgi:hypothetical protein